MSVTGSSTCEAAKSTAAARCRGLLVLCGRLHERQLPPMMPSFVKP